jgi:HAMP domain
VLVARRFLRPIHAIRAATHRLAAGHYGEVLTEPGVPELAAVGERRQLAGRRSPGDRTASSRPHRRRRARDADPLTTLKNYADGLHDGSFTSDEVLAGIEQELTRLERLAGDLAAVLPTPGSD